MQNNNDLLNFLDYFPGLESHFELAHHVCLLEQSKFVRRIDEASGYGITYYIDLPISQSLENILCPIPYNEKPFVLRETLDQNSILFWLQLVKSKCEAQGYFYFIEFTHRKYGKYQYEGKFLNKIYVNLFI